MGIGDDTVGCLAVLEYRGYTHGGASHHVATCEDLRVGRLKRMWAQGGHVRSLRNLDLHKKQDLPKKAIDELRSFADLARRRSPF